MFEGQVQVVVNKNGEVLSVREGFLVAGQPVKLKAALSARTRASLKHLNTPGGNVDPSFAETYARDVQRPKLAICQSAAAGS